MAVTYGFYNSKEGDRRYDAIQMSSIFDGIIMDGIFQNIGTAMMVKAVQGMMINVGIGRAWFDHTWTLNDSPLPLTVDLSEVILHRIDAVVLDVDEREDVRANNIILIKGTPSSSPVAPTLIKENDHKQYPLAYIRVNAGVTEITQSAITNKVGSTETPFIVCPLEHVSVDELLTQWTVEWREFYDAKTTEMENEVATWQEAWQSFYRTYTTDMENTANHWRTTWNETYNTYKAQFDAFYDGWVNKMDTSYSEWEGEWDTWYIDFTTMNRNVMDTWRNEEQAAFDAWFADIQTNLSGDVAGNLEVQIKDLQDKTDKLEEIVMDHEYGPDGTLNVYRAIFDSSYDPSNPDVDTRDIIMDNENRPIKSTTRYILETPTISKNKKLIERGMFLGNEITEAQAEAINKGTFENIYLGDYWEFQKEDGEMVRAVVVDFNYRARTGPVMIEDKPSITVISIAENTGPLSFRRYNTSGDYMMYFGRLQTPVVATSIKNTVSSVIRKLSEKIELGKTFVGEQAMSTSSETSTFPQYLGNYVSDMVVPELSMFSQEKTYFQDSEGNAFAFSLKSLFSHLSVTPLVLSYFANGGLEKIAAMTTCEMIVYSGIWGKKSVGYIVINNHENASYEGWGREVQLSFAQGSIDSGDSNIISAFSGHTDPYAIPLLFKIQGTTKRVLPNI